MQVGKFNHHDGCGCSACTAMTNELRDEVFRAAMAMMKFHRKVVLRPWPLKGSKKVSETWGELFEALRVSCHRAEDAGL